MAVKTMQNTLQNVVLEKEEIGIRYGELKEQYRKFHNEQVDIVRNLNQQVKTLEQQRVRNGQQRVVNSLANWSTNKVQNAWNKWIELTKEKRRYEENKQVMATLERKVDDRVAKIRGNQAALLAMKLLQQAARRSFILWRDSTRRNVERRRKGARFAEKRSKRQLQRVIMCWRREFQKEKYYRLGMSKIERLVAFSLRRWGMRKWSVQTFRLVLEEKDRRLSALNGTMELQTKTIVGLEMALDESQNARRELQRRQEEEKMKYAEKIETHQAAALAVRQKLGRFFTKQYDRQLLKDILREWRTMATYLLGVRKRTDLAQAKLRTLKLKRSVNNWHYRALQTHKKRLKTLQILSRMRHLGVLKCFNSWRELVNEQKSRKTALLYAVNRIRNRGIARCFSQWVAFKEQRISLRSGIESMAALAIKQQLFFMFSSWKEQVTTLKIAAQVRQQQLIQQAWENRLEQAKRDLNFQRECFTQWHKLVLQRQRHDIVVKKCLARLKNVFLAKSLGSWREFVENRKNQRDLVRRWVARCNTGALQRAWNRWQRQNVLKEQQLLMLRLQQERDAELKQLETEFELYRTAQQMLREETEQIQTEQKKTLKETRIRLQEETKRAQRFAVAVETLCSNKDRESTQLRCFKAWYAVVRRSDYFRKTVDIFQNTLDVRQTRKILTKWRKFTSQQRRLNAIFTTIQSCLSRWWQIQCFKAWKEARRRSRAVQIFSTLFCRNSEISISREVLTEWRKLARKNHLLRKTLEKIWLGSVHAKMRQQFRHWVEITKAEATKEQIEKRNVALAEIRAKVWWKQSVSTMRFCFSEWKETVETRKKQRLAERKLLLFQRTRLITVCFKNWAELVAIRSKAEERNQQFACWLRKLQRRKQQRAMTLWKILVIRNQQRDLEELKKVRSNQQEELQLQREEIALLMCTAAETKRKLADVTDIHDESTIKMLYLTECGLVAKYFNALKLKVSMRRYQRQAVHFSQKIARRRHLAEVFSNWHSFSEKSRAVKLLVAQKLGRCHIFLSRNILRQWQSIACQHRVIKQKQRKLQQRIRKRIIKNTFEAWRRSIRRERNISTAMDQLEIIVRRLKLKHTLFSWQQRCIHERNRAIQEREKHKKVMQFLMGRQEAGLVRTFHSWKEHTQFKRDSRSQAQQRYTTKCQAILVKCWDDWCSIVRATQLQRKSIVCIQTVTKRYYYRIALSRWRRYRFLSQIRVLQAGNEQLSHQIADNSQQLHSKSMSVNQLSSELVKLQEKLHEVESRSSAVSLEVTSQELNRSKQLICLSVLSKIMLKRTVSREVSEAFALWKIKIFDIRRKHRALVSVANVRQRRKRLFAFWLWKVKMLRWRQLDSLRKLWGRSDLLAILQRWRKFSTTQAKLRLFLTKRCLLSYTTRCLPVSIAFRLWKTKAAALHQLATLHTELQSEQDSSTTHLRRLALGKWCWIAYHHRLRQMRAFLSRCYVNSTKTNAVRYRRAIEEMQLTSEAALAKVKEQSEARAHEEMGALSAAEEQLTAGASFQALQTLIRRLFQPTSLKDLFVSVSSTFAQILHGSAAVLFLFDPSSNELWTQREENQLIQVPASLGIAGSTLSSGSTLIVTDVSSDPRFHPMVSFKFTLFLISNLKVVCIVEQMIFEMLRNCRDRVRARLPEKFIKLFNQNKNWRKYYALIERKATELENKLRDVLEEREQLIQSKSELHKRHQLVKDKLESSQQNTKNVSKLVTDWKKKLVKWQQELDEKDQAIGKKTSELEKVETEFERYRHERRSKDLQNVLNSPTKPPRGEECDESQSLSDHGQLSILRADKTRLKSQLIRAEADNLLLVKAISISRSQHGELPRTIQAEVTRVATRVSRRAPSEA
ncbi:GAF domain-like [Phytophthora cactorum]|nr:GAF domain-like [Phytophthora cactorum]